MSHRLFDVSWGEMVTYLDGREVEYETCADHAHHDEPGRYLCVYRDEDGDDVFK